MFDHINVSDSLSDPEGSRGFVAFGITPKANLPDGTEITNRAGIIFDLNEPVITNTTLNTIRDNPFPIVDFASDRQCGAIDNIFDFTYTGGTPDNAAFLWDFGSDATPSTSTLEEPADIVFGSAGTKAVTLTITRFGCVDSISKVIEVFDVSCGKNQDKVLVCHLPPGNPINTHIICINPADVPNHIAHGDCVNPCGSSYCLTDTLWKSSTGTMVSVYVIRPIITGNGDVPPPTHGLSIFPNPNNGHFTLSTNNRISEIRIINVLGETVYLLPLTSHLSPVTIDISNFPKGIYFLNINTPDGVTVRRVVKE